MAENIAFTEGEVFNARHRFDVAKAVRASRLPMGAKVTWMALFDRTYDKRNHVPVAYETLASDIGTARRQAIRYVRVLVKAGLIHIRPQRRRSGVQGVNHFMFLWRDPALIRGVS